MWAQCVCIIFLLWDFGTVVRYGVCVWLKIPSFVYSLWSWERGKGGDGEWKGLKGYRAVPVIISGYTNEGNRAMAI